VGRKSLLWGNLAGRQGFEPRYRGPEAVQKGSVILGFLVFVRKIANGVCAVSGWRRSFRLQSFKFLSSHVRLIHTRRRDASARVRESNRTRRIEALSIHLLSIGRQVADKRFQTNEPQSNWRLALMDFDRCGRGPSALHQIGIVRQLAW
jgi:hypothetical protein